MKVSGCDGNTKCGEVDTSPDYISEIAKNRHFQLAWERKDSKFKLKKIEKKKPVQTKKAS